MQLIPLAAKAHRRRICSSLALCLAVLVIGVIPGFAGWGLNAGYRDIAQDLKKVNLSVEDGRPVAKAILMLEARYGWVITYEDPRYAHPDEIIDVTVEVRRDLNKYSKGAAPKVLVPKGGELSFEFDVLSPLNVPLNAGVVVGKLLSAQASSANSGSFRMEQGNNIIHVIPTASKDASGKLIAHKSVLDATITLPYQERTGLQMLEALCKALSITTKTRVTLGTVPLGLFINYREQREISNQKAREVLVELFERANQGRKLSWRLLYGPDTKMYILNIHLV